MRQFLSPANRRRLRAEDGLSLIEIMIAGFVLSIAVLGLASVASASLVSVRDARERDRSTAVVSSAIEAVRALDYGELALATGGDWTNDPLIVFDTDDNAYYLVDDNGDQQAIWAAAGGALDPYECTAETVDCWFDVPSQSRANVRVFVTWYPDGVQRESKRITVISEWDDASYDAPRQVRMSTLVSPASRGLPAPAFEVRPPASETLLDEAWIEAAISDDEECFEHNLTNFGGMDRYDLVLDSGWTTKSPVVDGTFQSAKWYFRAFFVPDGEAKDTTHLMKSPDATSPLRSQVALATGESARVHLCYKPKDDPKPAPGDAPFVFSPVFHSVFDANIQQPLQHTIVINDEDHFVLYLHDEPGHTGNHERSWKHPRQANTTFDWDQFPMSPTPPGSLVPPRTSMFDYDTGVTWNNSFAPLDTGGIDGLWLRASPVTLHGASHAPADMAAEWDFQFTKQTAPVTFTGSATLQAWYRTRPSDDDINAPPPFSSICLGLELVQLRHNGHPVANPDGGIVARALVEIPASPSWTLRTATIEWEPGGPNTGPGNVSFDDKQYLRLRMWNAVNEAEMILANPANSCIGFHVSYGASTRPSSLRGELP